MMSKSEGTKILTVRSTGCSLSGNTSGGCVTLIAGLEEILHRSLFASTVLLLSPFAWFGGQGLVHRTPLGRLVFLQNSIEIKLSA